VVLANDDFMALATKAEEINNLINTNLAGEQIDQFTLDQIRVPSGGILKFKVIDEDDEEQFVKEVEGIIVHHMIGRAYWEKGIDEGAEQGPPDCSSSDGFVGVGNPGGSCANCDFNQWGTGDKGKGKACREFRHVFILTPDSLIPTVMVFPPTSVKNYTKFAMRKTGRNESLHARTTVFSLEEAQSGGIKYGKIKVKSGKHLTPEQVKVVEAYIAKLTPMFQSFKPDFANEGTGSFEESTVEVNAETVE